MTDYYNYIIYNENGNATQTLAIRQSAGGHVLRRDAVGGNLSATRPRSVANVVPTRASEGGAKRCCW